MHFKKVGMSAVPNIQVFNLTAQDKFLLCGCDGFWSCFSPQDAVQAVADMLEKGKFLKAICDRLIYMVRLSVNSDLIQLHAYSAHPIACPAENSTSGIHILQLA